jgi:FkbM family methyltransferase
MRKLLSTVFNAVNRIIAPFGVRLQRKHAPTRSFALFFEHLKRLDFDIRTVVDVGVAFGTPPIYEAFPKAKYFLIEPVAECKPVLEDLQQRLNAEYFLVAAGAINGEVTFNVHDDISGSSLFAQAEGRAFDGEERSTQMRRLDSILPVELGRPVLLKIDTQGAEIEVLKGLGDRIDEIDLLILETSMMPMRHGIPEFADVIRYCDEAGFAVYDILEGHMRALDRALAQIDVAMVRKDSPLRKNAAFFSPDQLTQYLKTSRKRTAPQAEVQTPSRSEPAR